MTSKIFMSEERKERKDRNNDTSKPDEETMHTTDPQEHMEGPVSSPMKKMGEAFDTDQNKKDADEEKERKL
jgi:hypothetical protein